MAEQRYYWKRYIRDWWGDAIGEVWYDWWMDEYVFDYYWGNSYWSYWLYPEWWELYPLGYYSRY